MLYDVVCYPVSALLWCWHELFALVLGPGPAWPPAVVFLVLTLRTLLLRPALVQLRAARAMHRLAPQVAALRRENSGDRARLAAELQALQREHGVSPLGGCLPALVQLPVFLGLLHVLHQFTAGTAAYVFDTGDVRSFLGARLLTAPLAAYARMPAEQLAALGVQRWSVLAVAVPLAALAAVATYVTSRQTLRRQPPGTDRQAVLTGRLLLYGLPAGALLSGTLFAFPVVTLLYWLANNACTVVQQAVLHRRLDLQDRAAGGQAAGGQATGVRRRGVRRRRRSGR